MTENFTTRNHYNSCFWTALWNEDYYSDYCANKEIREVARDQQVYALNLRASKILRVRRRKILLGTTDSKHGLPIYPNLAADMILTSIDQLWVADITYIRLQWSSCIWRLCWTPFPDAAPVGHCNAVWNPR